MTTEPMSTTMTRLVHDDPDCTWWVKRGQWNITFNGHMLYLMLHSTEYGSWSKGETPNCPACGENLFVEVDGGDYISVWSWFDGIDADSAESGGHVAGPSDPEWVNS